MIISEKLKNKIKEILNNYDKQEDLKEQFIKCHNQTLKVESSGLNRYDIYLYDNGTLSISNSYFPAFSRSGIEEDETFIYIDTIGETEVFDELIDDRYFERDKDLVIDYIVEVASKTFGEDELKVNEFVVPIFEDIYKRKLEDDGIDLNETNLYEIEYSGSYLLVNCFKELMYLVDDHYTEKYGDKGFIQKILEEVDYNSNSYTGYLDIYFDETILGNLKKILEDNIIKTGGM